MPWQPSLPPVGGIPWVPDDVFVPDEEVFVPDEPDGGVSPELPCGGMPEVPEEPEELDDEEEEEEELDDEDEDEPGLHEPP